MKELKFVALPDDVGGEAKVRDFLDKANLLFAFH